MVCFINYFRLFKLQKNFAVIRYLPIKLLHFFYHDGTVYHLFENTCEVFDFTWHILSKSCLFSLVMKDHLPNETPHNLVVALYRVKCILMGKLQRRCNAAAEWNYKLTYLLYSVSSMSIYHQISNISCTKSQNLNVTCLILQLSLPNPLKPGVKSGMKM